MPVQANRFTPFPDKATNLGVIDLLDLENKDPLSAEMNGEDGATPTDSEALGMCTGDSSDIDSSLDPDAPPGKDPGSENVTGEETRNTLDGNTSFTKMSDKLTGTQISRITDNPSIASSLVASSSPKCNTKLAGNSSGGSRKPIPPTMGCNGTIKPIKSSCGTEGKSSKRLDYIKDAINKVSGLKYPVEIEKLDTIIKSVTALSKLGYSNGLCGVFPALSSVTENVGAINHALGDVISDANMNAMTDAFNDIGNVANKMNALSKYPAAIKDSLKNFKIPTNIKDLNVKDFYDRYKSATGLIAGIPSVLEETVSSEPKETINSDISMSSSIARNTTPFAPPGTNSTGYYDLDSPVSSDNTDILIASKPYSFSSPEYPSSKADFDNYDFNNSESVYKTTDNNSDPVISVSSDTGLRNEAADRSFLNSDVYYGEKYNTETDNTVVNTSSTNTAGVTGVYDKLQNKEQLSKEDYAVVNAAANSADTKRAQGSPLSNEDNMAWNARSGLPPSDNDEYEWVERPMTDAEMEDRQRRGVPVIGLFPVVNERVKKINTKTSEFGYK